MEEGAVKLGQSVDLLQGYKPTVFLGTDGKSPLVPSTQPALFEKRSSIQNPNVEAKWDQFPTISLHKTAEELLSGLQHIRLQSHPLEKAEGRNPAVWPAGALTLAGLSDDECKKALTDLSAEIGLDLSEPDYSYALVRRSRKIGTAVHPNFQSRLFRNIDPQGTLRPETLQALKKLEKKSHPYEVSKDGAIGYLEFYTAFGSHFVSSVDYGDSLFQVSI